MMKHPENEPSVEYMWNTPFPWIFTYSGRLLTSPNSQMSHIHMKEIHNCTVISGGNFKITSLGIVFDFNMGSVQVVNNEYWGQDVRNAFEKKFSMGAKSVDDVIGFEKHKRRYGVIARALRARRPASE